MLTCDGSRSAHRAQTEYCIAGSSLPLTAAVTEKTLQLHTNLCLPYYHLLHLVSEWCMPSYYLKSKFKRWHKGRIYRSRKQSFSKMQLALGSIVKFYRCLFPLILSFSFNCWTGFQWEIVVVKLFYLGITLMSWSPKHTHSQAWGVCTVSLKFMGAAGVRNQSKTDLPWHMPGFGEETRWHH